MIDGSEKCNRQLAFELQNLHVCEKRSNNCYLQLSAVNKLLSLCFTLTCIQVRNIWNSH